MTRFRLKPRDPGEAEIQKQIIEALWMEPRVYEVKRVNTGKIQGFRDSYRWYRKGQESSAECHPDIEGQLVDGRRFLFEIKQRTGKASDGQQEYIDGALQHKAIGGVVRSADEAIEIIREAFK